VVLIVYMKHALKNSTILLLLLSLVSTGKQLRAQSGVKPPLWIATWGASQQIPEPQNALAADDLRDATVRQFFHLSAGGTEVRVHLSNAFGTQALHFTSVHIAHPLFTTPAAIDTATDKALAFAGNIDVTIPPGAEFVSDPIEFRVSALSDLAVTFHLDTPPTSQTGHPGSRATSYYVHGDYVAAANMADPKQVDHWYQVSEIDVLSAPGGGAIVALGDSITDGHGATTNGNDRWTDVLAARLRPLQAAGASVSRIRESAATTCSQTAWGRMRLHALIAMYWHLRACAG
jgi:hypothetical protein